MNAATARIPRASVRRTLATFGGVQFRSLRDLARETRAVPAIS